MKKFIAILFVIISSVLISTAERISVVVIKNTPTSTTVHRTSQKRPIISIELYEDQNLLEIMTDQDYEGEVYIVNENSIIVDSQSYINDCIFDVSELSGGNYTIKIISSSWEAEAEFEL